MTEQPDAPQPERGKPMKLPPDNNHVPCTCDKCIALSLEKCPPDAGEDYCKPGEWSDSPEQELERRRNDAGWLWAKHREHQKELAALRRENERLENKLSKVLHDDGRLKSLAEIDRLGMAIEWDPINETPVDAALKQIEQLRRENERLKDLPKELERTRNAMVDSVELIREDREQLENNQKALADAKETIERLTAERDELKRRVGKLAQAIGDIEEVRVQRDRLLKAAEAVLEVAVINDEQAECKALRAAVEECQR